MSTCQTCLHWQRDVDPMMQWPPLGTCNRITGEFAQAPDKPGHGEALMVEFDGEYGGGSFMVLTDAAFGCSMHEPIGAAT